jgi:aspartyl-tRNA(Asn)/glutamyl-tRNA(Gln) amidotransferase subunit A
MLEHPSLDAEIRSTLLQFLADRKAEGYTVRELDFELMDFIVPTYYVLTTAEASSNLSRYDGVRYGYVHQPPASDLTDFYTANRSHGFGAEVQRRILLGNFVLSAGYFDAYYTKAQQVRRKLFDHINLVFKEIDLLVAPVSPGTAFLLGEKTSDPLEMYLADIYTVYANLTGVPALALPLFRHRNGLPFGLQLHACHLNEVSLLQTGHRWMQQAPTQPTA